MLELAGEMADGAFPYNVTVEHTAQAREILGPDKLLCVEPGVILETDPAAARARARAFLAHHFERPNYTNHWCRLGFSDGDFVTGGSDRLVDAIIAWGEAVHERIEAHWDAGADHVCIQAIGDLPGARVTSTTPLSIGSRRVVDRIGQRQASNLRVGGRFPPGAPGLTDNPAYFDSSFRSLAR